MRKKTQKLAESVRSASVRETLTAVRERDLVSALGGATGKDDSGVSGPACGHYDYLCPA